MRGETRRQQMAFHNKDDVPYFIKCVQLVQGVIMLISITIMHASCGYGR